MIDKAPLTLAASTRVHGSGTVAGWVRVARSVLSPHRLPHVSALRLRALGAWSWSHSVGLPKVAAEPRSSRPLSRSASGATRCSSTSTVIFLRYSGLPRVIARASTTGCVQRAPADHLGELVVDVDASTESADAASLPRRTRPRPYRRGQVGRVRALAAAATRRWDRGLRRRRDRDTTRRHGRGRRPGIAGDPTLLPVIAAGDAFDGATDRCDPRRGTRGFDQVPRRRTLLGAPVVARVSVDPAIARAVNSGLLAARLPWAIGRELRGVAA